MKRVGDVMTHRVITIHDRAPFKDVVRLIRQHGVSGLPVLDPAGRLVGIVSEADLILKEEHAVEGSSRRFGSKGGTGGRNGVPPWIRRNKARGLLARDLMTAPVVTVAPGDAVALAARIMRENRVRRLPVTTADGELVGIVSRSDLLAAFLRPDDEIRAGIERALTEPRPSIDEGQIGVLVENGVAMLEGRVAYKSQIPRIVSIARTIDGVVDVVSRLEYEVDDVDPEKVGPGPWAHAAAGGDDTWRSP